MNNRRFYFSLLVASILGGAVALGGYSFLIEEPRPKEMGIDAQQQYMQFSRYKGNSGNAARRSDNLSTGINFTDGAAKATPAVVHIKTYYDGYAKEHGRYSMEELLEDFFGGEAAPEGFQDDMGRIATGSGVIISPDGYIATNSHVVEGATRIQVELNDKRSFEAVVMGNDPSTDLALLKVEGEDQLPFIPYGNSDEVKVGQWVMAVGNPFDLTSTVTAGIVSAKGRNINILRSKSRLSIEAFIQTDAAVNPGNSGGALIDLKGNLVGINTAIATNTGSYAGYSFAVPVSLVRKVMADLQEYGEVRRALMGVSIQDLDAELASKIGAEEIRGVYISGIASSGGAAEAGIVPGDIVVEIDGRDVNSVSNLQELVARHRPGEQIKVSYKRKGQAYTTVVTLQGQSAEPIAMQPPDEDGPRPEDARLSIPEFGGVLSPISDADRSRLQIEGGARVVEITDSRLSSAGMKEGFIITKIDRQPINTPQDVRDAVIGVSGGLLVEGYNANGEREFIGVGF